MEFSRKSEDLEDVLSYYAPAHRSLLVSVISGRIVGVIALKEMEENKMDVNKSYNCCEISRIFVHPHCRSLGIASRLLSHIEEIALNIGYSTMKVQNLSKKQFILLYYD